MVDSPDVRPERPSLTEATGLAVGVVLDRERQAAAARGEETVAVALDRRLLLLIALAIVRAATMERPGSSSRGVTLDVTSLDRVRLLLLEQPQDLAAFRPARRSGGPASALIGRPPGEAGTVPEEDAAALDRLAADPAELREVTREAVAILDGWSERQGPSISGLRSAARWCRVRDLWLDRPGTSPIVDQHEDDYYLY